jgi:hypothetical protein
MSSPPKFSKEQAQQARKIRARGMVNISSTRMAM